MSACGTCPPCLNGVESECQNRAYANTDRELWRAPKGDLPSDYYAGHVAARKVVEDHARASLSTAYAAYSSQMAWLCDVRGITRYARAAGLGACRIRTSLSIRHPNPCFGSTMRVKGIMVGVELVRGELPTAHTPVSVGVGLVLAGTPHPPETARAHGSPLTTLLWSSGGVFL